MSRANSLRTKDHGNDQCLHAGASVSRTQSNGPKKYTVKRAKEVHSQTGQGGTQSNRGTQSHRPKRYTVKRAKEVHSQTGQGLRRYTVKEAKEVYSQTGQRGIQSNRPRRYTVKQAKESSVTYISHCTTCSQSYVLFVAVCRRRTASALKINNNNNTFIFTMRLSQF